MLFFHNIFIIKVEYSTVKFFESNKPSKYNLEKDFLLLKKLNSKICNFRLVAEDYVVQGRVKIMCIKIFLLSDFDW